MQLLGVYAALAEDRSLAPRSHVQQFVTTCSSAPDVHSLDSGHPQGQIYTESHVETHA